MKNVVVCLTFLISLGVFSKTIDKKASFKMSEKWHTINNLINQEVETIKSLGRIGPKLQHRLLELNSEKIKLIKEKENQVFLKSPKKLIRQKGKKWFFKESRAMFSQVKKDGYKLIKSFPRFKNKANIFYTLALNERDYGGDKKTEYYLLRALKHSRKRDKIVHLAKTSLAEYHYNNKNYPLAIKYYNAVLENKKDDWYTKHLFNQAWCLLKEKDYNKGIENLKTAFEYSKNPNYVSVKDQILEAFAVFFVHGNQITEGISFYVENLEDPTDYLISMAKKTASKGLFSETRQVIKASLMKARELKAHSKEVDIRLLELEIYRNFKQFELHFETSIALQKLQKQKAFSSDQKEDATQKLKSLVNYLQIRLSKNKKLGNENHDPRKLKEVISYFEILSTVDKDNTDQYSFYSGETQFSVGNYQDAADFYMKSLEHGKNKKDEESKKLKRKVLDSFLALLGNSRFKDGKNHSYTIYAYQSHLDIWPVDSKSQKIYVKLYNLYLEKKMIRQALLTFNAYMKSYPTDGMIQQGMVTHLMDHYVKVKDSAALTRWIARFEKGFLGFKKDYVEKALAVLGQLLFEKYEEMDRKGEKGLAVKGFTELYHDERYPVKIKAISALNASILYLELTNSKSSYEWLRNSMKHHKKSDLEKLIPKMGVMANQYALLQDFKSSSLLSRDVLKKFCHQKIKEKEEFYYMAVHHHLIENNFEGAIKNSMLGEQCAVRKEAVIELNKKMIAHLANHRKYKSFFDFYQIHKDEEVYYETFSSHLINIFWDTKFFWKPKLHGSVKSILMSWKKKNKLPANFITNIELVNRFEEYSKRVERIRFELPKLAKFDEKAFNTALEQNLAVLQDFTTRGEALIEKGHKESTLLTYSLLEKKYLDLSDVIDDFTPKGMPKEFIQGFKKHMSNLVGNLREKSLDYNKNARRVIEDNKILSFSNFKFIKLHQFVEEVQYRYPAGKLVSTADLGGEQ